MKLRVHCRKASSLVLCVLLTANCTPLQRAEDQLEALRTQSELASGLEESIGVVPAITYEFVRDEWEEVRRGYADVLSSSPNNTEAQELIAIIEKRIRLLEIEHAYASQIQIRNLERGPGTRRHFGIPAEGIFGEVKNLGEWPVVRVDLQFELLDAANQPVAERDWTPVAEHHEEGPLKPNYTRPFGFVVERPPSDWVGVRGVVKLVRLSREGTQLPRESTGQ